MGITYFQVRLCGIVMIHSAKKGIGVYYVTQLFLRCCEKIKKVPMERYFLPSRTLQYIAVVFFFFFKALTPNICQSISMKIHFWVGQHGDWARKITSCPLINLYLNASHYLWWCLKIQWEFKLILPQLLNTY